MPRWVELERKASPDRSRLLERGLLQQSVLTEEIDNDLRKEA